MPAQEIIEEVFERDEQRRMQKVNAAQNSISESIENLAPPKRSANTLKASPTVYLDFTGRQQWEFSARDICPFCGLPHVEGCRARFCDSCTQYWLAELEDDNGEGRPVKEYCPSCLRCDCGNELDETNAGELCGECKRQAEADAAWKEFTGTCQGYDRSDLESPVVRTLGELAVEMQKETDRILTDLDRKANEAVAEILAKVDAPKKREAA